MSQFFDAISNAVRLQILFELLENEMYVKKIADRLERKVENISRQLRILRDNSLLESETRGRYRYYRLRRPTLIKAVQKIYDLLTRREECKK